MEKLIPNFINYEKFLPFNYYMNYSDQTKVYTKIPFNFKSIFQDFNLNGFFIVIYIYMVHHYKIMRQISKLMSFSLREKKPK